MSQIPANWPVLNQYDQAYTRKIAMPIGGIGTGTISLNGRGGLQDWEIMNRPAKGFNPSIEQNRAPFFAINVKKSGSPNKTRLLEGPAPGAGFEGSMGATIPNHGLPRFAHNAFSTAYPFGKVNLTDPEMPVDVEISGFNPLIPGNVEDSSIPMVYLNYKVTNTSERPVEVSISGSIPNFIGYDGKEGQPKNNVNTFREEGDFKGIYFSSEGVAKDSEQWGTIGFATTSEGDFTYRTAWMPYHWGSSTLDFWDDFGDDGLLENRPENDNDMPMGSLALKKTIPPHSSENFSFVITWHFPNRMAWRSDKDQWIGNYYTNQYDNAWDVMNKEIPRLPSLAARTKTFVNTFLSSDLPKEVKEAALFNLSHLRTQLTFRINDGHFFGWEGNFEHEGACFGSCTHVWNYEQTTPFLFGELAKSMRDVEFNYATDAQGLMSFRVHLPLDSAQKWGKAAADGQMGSIVKFYRDWQLSGDDQMLKRLWPKVKSALEFAWIDGGWDADEDGVMEGAQHNTMDVEYYGPNPQMGFWYLAALKASQAMANYVGEEDFAVKCARLYKNGSRYLDENLFNGEYYEHKIMPPGSKENIASSLLVGMGAEDFEDPDYQLGRGCLVDQMVGQMLAHVTGLGYLADEDNIKSAHKAIMKFNHRESLDNHTNFMRSFALENESALLMASYPKGRPETPFPYFTEVMTGFEYTAAVGMLYEGQYENGLQCIRDIRNRYDGKKRNSFNEAEYGNHYARAMAAWASVLALTGFHYSGVDKTITFNADNGTYIWSNGYSYGKVEKKGNGNHKEVKLTVNSGSIDLKQINLTGYGKKVLDSPLELEEGENLTIEVNKN